MKVLEEAKNNEEEEPKKEGIKIGHFHQKQSKKSYFYWSLSFWQLNIGAILIVVYLMVKRRHNPSRRRGDE